MNTQSDSELPFSRITGLLATPPNDVWRIHYEALKRIERGEEITLLSVGDPDFDTPEAITQHLVERINAGRTHYSPPAQDDISTCRGELLHSLINPAPDMRCMANGLRSCHFSVRFTADARSLIG